MARSLASFLALIVALTAIGSAPAFADLRADTDITYTAKVHDGVIHLSADLLLTNTTPNRRQGNTIVQYYYDRIPIYVPDIATNVVATSNGRDLDVELTDPDDEEAEGTLLATVKFGRNIFYKRQFEMTLEYDMPGDPPRSDSIFRVNPGYFNFGVFGWGHPGRVSVSVVTPDDFSVVLDGSELEAVHGEDGTLVYSVDGIEDLEEFFVNVRGWNDDALVRHELEVEGVPISVHSWPDDPEWAADVIEAVEVGLPELRDLVGLDWVTDDELEISELLETNLAGYGGWYLIDEHEIKIGEWVDPWLVLHELSHAWFNDGLFEERWINEGLAEEFSLQAVDRAGLDDADWLRPTISPFSSPSLDYLTDWVLPVDLGLTDQSDIDAYEQAGYESSFWVVQEVTSEIGIDALAAVVQSADEDLIAYRGATDPESVDPNDGWRRFLDLLEEVGGSETATDLFVEFVTNDDLTERTAVRNEYQALEDRGDAWQPPYFVRSPLSEWEFEEASARIEAANGLLDSRDRIADNYGVLEVPMSASLEETYESASDAFDQAESVAETLIRATETAIEARDLAEAEPDFVEWVGLIGEDLALEYRDVHQALASEQFNEVASEARELTGLSDGAKETGRNRLLMASGALLLFGLVSFLGVRRLRRRRNHPEATPADGSGEQPSDEDEASPE